MNCFQGQFERGCKNRTNFVISDNEPTLRNCPFCGGKAYLKAFCVPFEENNDGNEYRVGCEECGIYFKSMWEYTQIVDLWNGVYYK